MAKAKGPNQDQFERVLAKLLTMSPQAIRIHRHPSGDSYQDSTFNLCWKIWRRAFASGQRNRITRQK